jgi:DNA invertase Pin-like site-specific DNA recombinase
MRAVVYARYSSDQQREASIEDQIRLARAHIDGRGWIYLHAYGDRAISAASALRPGYQRLLADARGRRFDVVVAEALDRLSRDQEDVAALCKPVFCRDPRRHASAQTHSEDSQKSVNVRCWAHGSDRLSPGLG